MRTTIYAILGMFLVACTEGATKSSLEDYDGGDSASIQELTDSESIQDSNQGKDSEVDSEIKDSDQPEETDSQDSNQETDTSDTEVLDSETEEPESCVFSEKGLYRCDDNTIMVCKEDPNSSTIELIWQEYVECPVSTECRIEGTLYCDPIGECRVGQLQCNENNSQVLECVLDEETGGGVWEVKEKCVAQGLKCWPYGYMQDGRIADPKCVPSDWVYCGQYRMPAEIDCIKNYIVECSYDLHWEVLKDCNEGNLTCGQVDGDWICYDKCDYMCADTTKCSKYNGTIVYNAGECFHDTVCCKLP